MRKWGIKEWCSVIGLAGVIIAGAIRYVRIDAERVGALRANTAATKDLSDQFRAYVAAQTQTIGLMQIQLARLDERSVTHNDPK